MIERYAQLRLFDPGPVDMPEDDLMAARGQVYKLARMLKDIETMAVTLADYFQAKRWPGARVLDEASVAIGGARSMVAQLEENYRMTEWERHG